ncbi:hypothetical protein [Kitasatospora sp. NBC_01300]|nr:hypothetical protein OG556_13920 [Kitasatospora sp. NBC_01300]
MSANCDEEIDAWVEEQLALSPAWSAERWERISALLRADGKDQEDQA